MNREIKFRAWDYCKKIFLPTKTYAILSVTEFGATGIMITDFEEYKEGEYFYPNSQQINQYTGLKDKNGKDIYEGDVLSGYPHGNSFVSWDNEYGCWHSGIDLIGNEIKDMPEREVIGNIYENPELLQSVTA